MKPIFLSAWSVCIFESFNLLRVRYNFIFSYYDTLALLMVFLRIVLWNYCKEMLLMWLVLYLVVTQFKFIDFLSVTKVTIFIKLYTALFIGTYRSINSLIHIHRSIHIHTQFLHTQFYIIFSPCWAYPWSTGFFCQGGSAEHGREAQATA